MVSFQKKDFIEHPSYGLGQILNVRSVNSSFSILEVDFPSAGIRKELNSQWVEKNCTYQSSVPEAKTQFQDGVYAEDPSLSQGSWRVFPEAKAQGSEELREGLQYLMKSILPGIHFVQIDRYAAVLLSADEGNTNAQIEKAARKHMTRVFRGHPDFGYVENEDGSLVLTMLDACLCLFLKPEFVKRDAKGSPSLQLLLWARNALMSACDEKKIYAIVRSDPHAST